MREFSTTSNQELLIIDNSSSDDTYQIAKSHKCVSDHGQNTVRVVKIKHSCLSESRNTAASIANGEYVIYVDADARLSRGFVNILCENIKYCMPDIVHGRVYNDAHALKASEFIYRTLILPSYSNDNKPFIGAFMGFEKQMLTKVGFKSGLKRGDDTLIFEEFKSAGRKKVLYITNAWVYNEFPSRLTDWAVNIFNEGIYGGLIHKYLKIKRSKKFILTILIVLLIIAPLYGNSIFIVPYLCRHIDIWLEARLDLIHNNVPNYLLAVLVLFTSVSIRDVGYILGSIFFSPINSMKNNSEILEIAQR